MRTNFSEKELKALRKSKTLAEAMKKLPHRNRQSLLVRAAKEHIVLAQKHACRVWTAEEIALLGTASHRQVADMLGRTKDAVVRKFALLKKKNAVNHSQH